MENDGETGDDQESGWLEVRKKHRTGSKFSIQSLVGGFSSKTPSTSQHSRSFPNEKSGKSRTNRKSQPSKAGADLASHFQVFHDNSFLVDKVAEKAGNCTAKQSVDLDLEHPNSPPVRPVSVADLKSGTNSVHEVTQEEKVDMVHNIKWGDLEDDALVLHCQSAHRTKIKFGDIGDDAIEVYIKAGNCNDSLPCVPSTSFTDSQEEKGVVTHVGVNHAPDSLVLRDESAEKNHKELEQISSKDVGIPDLVENSEQINHDTFRLISTDSTNILGMSNPASNNCSVEKFPTTRAVQGQGPIDKSYDGAIDISGVPALNGISSMGDQISSSLPNQTISPEASGDAFVTAAAEDCRASQCSTINEDLPNVEMTTLEEGESGESKERFRQRLWCFLFENLNRAIDELYLLCELECDLDQMKEAIVVLEEAASDFNELNSRVKGFESVKRSSPMGSMQVNMKLDHRRPHALSWEVRRMTSSPHRAEILSSSLEAFKKIQQERATIRPDLEAKALGTGYPDSVHVLADDARKSTLRNDVIASGKESIIKSRKQNGSSVLGQGILNGEKRKVVEVGRSRKACSEQNGSVPVQRSSTPDDGSWVSLKDGPAASVAGKSRREHLGAASGVDKPEPKKDKLLTENKVEKNSKSVDSLKRQIPLPDKEKGKEKRNMACWKSMDAWKEKRNWEDILASPLRSYSRVSHSPGMSRKSVERARVLRDKLMSPEKKKEDCFGFEEGSRRKTYTGNED